MNRSEMSRDLVRAVGVIGDAIRCAGPVAGTVIRVHPDVYDYFWSLIPMEILLCDPVAGGFTLDGIRIEPRELFGLLSGVG